MLSRIEKMLALLDKKYWRALFWLYWSVCTLLLLLPGEYVPDFNIWDKLEHAGMFFPMLWLALLAYAPGLRLMPLTVTLVAYGITIELIQYFVPGRSCSGLDVLADTTGVVLATMTVVVWRKQIAS